MEIDKNLTERQTEMAFQALIAEYEAMRNASLSRDQIIGSLENFMMVVLSAAVVGLPTIIAQQQYIILLIFSIIMSLISLARRREGWMLYQLAFYKHEVLKPNLISLIRQADSTKQSLEHIDKLWSWQIYLNTRIGQAPLLRRFSRRLISTGLGPLFWLSSIGSLLLFLHYRGMSNLDMVETVLVIISTIYALLLSLLAIITIFRSFSPNTKDWNETRNIITKAHTK